MLLKNCQNIKYNSGLFIRRYRTRNLFNDPDMLKRLNYIEHLDKENKSHILSVIDGFIKAVKIKNIAAL